MIKIPRHCKIGKLADKKFVALSVTKTSRGLYLAKISYSACMTANEDRDFKRLTSMKLL